MAPKNIVLIHGWACDETVWQETRYKLEQKHRVFTSNLPLRQSKYSYRNAVIDFIVRHGLEQVILLGWSLGSLVALQTVLQIQPKVEGLVLVSGTSRFLTDSQPKIEAKAELNAEQKTELKTESKTESKTDAKAEPETELMPSTANDMRPYQGGISPALLTRMKKRLNKDLEQTLTDFYNLMFSSQEQEKGLAEEIILKHLNQGRKWELAEAQAGLDFLQETDVRAELKAITCPTLLLHGEEDNICPIAGAWFMQKNIPSAQLISYPLVGHIPFLTNAKDFHQALEEWLAVV